MVSGKEVHVEDFHPKSGNQIFSEVPKDQLSSDSIGRPIAHLSAEKHVTGEALFVDDIPKTPGKFFKYFYGCIYN